MPSPRDLPSIDLLTKRAGVADLESRYGAEATRTALREATAGLRDALRRQAVAATAAADLAAAVEADARHRLETLFAGSLRRVINATGVIVHTNLGRAPLGPAARPDGRDRRRLHQPRIRRRAWHARLARRPRRAARHHAHRRRAPSSSTTTPPRRCTMPAALAAGREVLIRAASWWRSAAGSASPMSWRSQGRGSVRSGRPTDPRRRLSRRRRAAHGRDPARPSLELPCRGLRRAAHARRPGRGGRELGSPVLEDAGSGNSNVVPSGSLRSASRCRRRRSVCFSGDKLLGGPQAGITPAARAGGSLRRHPLMRAFRVDSSPTPRSRRRCSSTSPVGPTRPSRSGGCWRRAWRRSRRERVTSARPCPARDGARLSCQASRPLAAAALPASACRPCCWRSSGRTGRRLRSKRACVPSTRRSSLASSTTASSSTCGRSRQGPTRCWPGC